MQDDASDRLIFLLIGRVAMVGYVGGQDWVSLIAMIKSAIKYYTMIEGLIVHHIILYQ